MRKTYLKTIVVSLLAGVLLSCFYSCSTHEIGTTYAPQTFSFRVVNVGAYTGSLNYSFYDNKSHAYSGDFYTDKIADNYLSIRLTDSTGLKLGTYVVGYDSVAHSNLAFVYYSNASHPYSSINGSLTITLLDTVYHTFSGKFNFYGTYLNDSRLITNGVLDQINYAPTH
jgi:hypothetical protein